MLRSGTQNSGSWTWMRSMYSHPMTSMLFRTLLMVASLLKSKVFSPLAYLPVFVCR